MTLVRYEPWRLVNRLHQQLDHVFGDTFGSPEASGSANSDWLPAVDVHEEAERFVVRADVPGVEPQGHRHHRRERRADDSRRAQERDARERQGLRARRARRRHVRPPLHAARNGEDRSRSRRSRSTACWRSPSPSSRRCSRAASRSIRNGLIRLGRPRAELRMALCAGLARDLPARGEEFAQIAVRLLPAASRSPVRNRSRSQPRRAARCSALR